MRKSAFWAAIAAMALSGAAAAETMTHEVTIFDNDFMPPVVFASPGDQIVFYNTDDWQHQIDAMDETWTTGVIDAMGSATITVISGDTQEYQLDETLFPEEDIDESEEEDVTEAGLIFEEATGNADEGEVEFTNPDIPTDS